LTNLLAENQMILRGNEAWLFTAFLEGFGVER